MTKTQLKNKLEQYFTDNKDSFADCTLSEAIEQTIGDDIINNYLSRAVYEVLEICLLDIQVGEYDYFKQADCYSDKLGFNIILSSDFWLGKNESDFLDQILELVNRAEKLETRLKGLK